MADVNTVILRWVDYIWDKYDTDHSNTLGKEDF